MGKRKSKSEPMLQATLFRVEDLPERDGLVELVKRGFLHTGKNLLGDEALCREIMISLIRNVSGRSIARTYKISRNSVCGIRRAMEERGLVEPLKKQISALLADNIVMGLEDFRDALATGELHPSQLPVPMGIFMTHKALIDGDPTVRVESGKPSELSVESVRAHFDAMKRAAITVDSESAGKVEKTQ